MMTEHIHELNESGEGWLRCWSPRCDYSISLDSVASKLAALTAAEERAERLTKVLRDIRDAKEVTGEWPLAAIAAALEEGKQP